MSHKRCAKCARELPVESFGFRNRSTSERHARCRDCIREYSREHYLANRQTYIGRAKANNQAVVAKKRALIDSLKAKPCADCGNTFPAFCMEFDHRDGRKVTGRNSPEAIANLRNDASGLPALLRELEKCDLVCVICHRIRTARRAGVLV